jgi:4-diphosphocytidyl-2-C-methyl-D-erythritol kinase
VSRRFSVPAPAKLNLGLEVVGKRADGYHEIATVMQAVSIYDRLSIERAEPEAGVTLCVDRAELAGDDNLALRAARLVRERLGVEDGAHLDLRKEIPIAAGLGGASSDAAAALRAVIACWDRPAETETLAAWAQELGSDVPFFLTGGAALAEGRGDRLTALPPLRSHWFVVVAPTLAEPIPRKTAALYAALGPQDRSSGDRVRAVAAAISAGRAIDPGLLDNAFRRPLYGLRPELRRVPEEMAAAGAPISALSGAGPAHYSIVGSEAAARALASRLAVRLGDRARVDVARPLVGTDPVSRL